MANPLTADGFLTALREEGVNVVQVGDWRTHNRNHMGPWGPVNGVMIHHTVTSGEARTVAMCRDGYAGLPGPLCHGVITKNGRVHLVGYGRANHAGMGDDDVLRAVIAETALPPDDESNTDGNRHFYGFECENLGNGTDPWPEVQLDAIERTAAALCRAHGWDKGSAIGHKEWQPGKIDPTFPMDMMRARIEERLRHPAGWNRGEGDQLVADVNDVKVLYKTDGVLASPDSAKATETNKYWTMESYLKSGFLQGRETKNLAASIENKVNALIAKPAASLTDAQIREIAAHVASSPTLAHAIADKVAELLAARLAN